jgi:peptidyl-prolyl cis-trans isomerase D
MFIGDMKDGLHTALVVKPDGAEEFWLLRYGDLYRLFVSPADYRVLPTFSGKVRHILIAWKGRGPVVPKDMQRTRDQAWKLANELMERANKGEDFVELQKQHNEDDDVDPTKVFDVGPTERLVKPFLRLSSQLEVGKAGVVESEFGFHVIKRIE